MALSCVLRVMSPSSSLLPGFPTATPWFLRRFWRRTAPSCISCPGGSDRDLGWRLRLLFYPVAMNLIYFLLGTAITRIHSGPEDAALQAVIGRL